MLWNYHYEKVITLGSLLISSLQSINQMIVAISDLQHTNNGD